MFICTIPSSSSKDGNRVVGAPNYLLQTQNLRVG